MTLDECRDALEMAKLSMKADATAAQVRQIIDWAENLQQFLEIVHGPKEMVEEVCTNCGGHSHVCEQEGADQVWIACPACKGVGKVQKPKEPRYPVLSAAQAAEQRKLPEVINPEDFRECERCNGTGVYFNHTCGACKGSGTEPPAQ